MLHDEDPEATGVHERNVRQFQGDLGGFSKGQRLESLLKGWRRVHVELARDRKNAPDTHGFVLEGQIIHVFRPRHVSPDDSGRVARMCLASIGSLVDEPQDRSVYVSVPARAEFLALLRTVTGGVATRMRLSLDAIDDLRLAVDEAVALLLITDRNASHIEMRLDPSDGELTATVGTDSPVELWPPLDYRSTLPWQVISGLTDAASLSRSDRGRPTITFVKRTLDARAT